MVKYVLAVAVSLIVAAVVMLLWKQYEVVDTGRRKDRLIMAASVLLLLWMNLFFCRHRYDVWEWAKWEILLVLCITTALIDHRKRIIPNKLLLATFVARTLLFLPEFLTDTKTAQMLLIKDLIGAVVCFGVLFVAGFLAKNQIGAGDVKLFGVIGYIFGIAGAYNTLFYSMLFALSYGVYQMLVHRSGRKYRMAFAPFVCLGCVCVLLMQAF